MAAMTPEERAKLILKPVGEYFASRPTSEFSFVDLWESLVSAIRAAVSEEREACAKLVESKEIWLRAGEAGFAANGCQLVAAAIRARGNACPMEATS